MIHQSDKPSPQGRHKICTYLTVCSILLNLILWYTWYHARPVGDAAVPGPPQHDNRNAHLTDVQRQLCDDPATTTLVSHNIRGGGGKALHLRSLMNAYDLAAVQEANIQENNMRPYAKILREANLQVRFGDAEHIGDESTRQARTLVATKNDCVLLDSQITDPELLHLQRSGRWKETTLFLEDGRSCMVVANLYGLPDASTSAASKRKTKK